MPIGTSDGVYYEDDFKFSSNQGQSVIKPTEDQMKDNNELHPESIPTPEMLSQMEFSAQSRKNFLSEAPQGAPQDASQSAINDRTRVLEGPEVSGYQTPENNAPVTGVRETIRQGAQAVRDATGIGQESFVKDFLTKLGNSKEYLDLYFEGKVDYNDPNLVHAVTTLASTVGNVGLASAPLRTNSLGTFGGLTGKANLISRRVDEEATKRGWSTDVVLRADPDGAETIMFEDPRMESLFNKALAHFVDQPEYRAKVMLDEGKSTKEILAETGMFFGRDGKLRFEIDDSSAKFIVGEAPGQYNPDSVYFSVDQARNALGKQTGEVLTLGEVFDHPELYKIYPEIKDIKLESVGLFDRLGGTKGWFNIDSNTLALSSTNTKDARSTMLHEIQHWIQKKEGFSRGGNPEEFKPAALKEAETKMAEYGEHLLTSIREAGLEKEEVEKAIEIAESLKDPKSYYNWGASEHIKNEVKQAKITIQRLSEAGLLTDVLKGVELGKALESFKKEAFDNYQKLYGEIESRNVQFRDELREILNKGTARDLDKDLQYKDLPISKERRKLIQDLLDNPLLSEGKEKNFFTSEFKQILDPNKAIFAGQQTPIGHAKPK